MKKKIIIIISVFLIFAAILCACTDPFQKEPSSSDIPQDTAASEEAKIKDLEAQITALLQSQQLSEAERKKEIAALTAEIERLKQNSEASTNAPSTEASTSAESFKYIVENGKATITEITAVGESVIIPATIDGYQVCTIGSEVISSQNVKSIIISDGIEKLDWFSFRGCLSLSSISIPNSVTSIGYGAFDNTSKSLVIICTRDSFAHRYAQSYGLTYDIT